MTAGDMLDTIIPKSDQLNADDLIGKESMTITITGVRIRAGDQPCAIEYEGGKGKPWLACKSMRRVLVEAWGDDSAAYVGRRVTLVRDPSVRFGKDEVGGIRIAALSNIDRTLRIPLTVTKGKRAPFTVEPLAGGPPSTAKPKRTKAEATADAKKKADEIVAEINACKTEDAVKALLIKHADTLDRMGTLDVGIPANVKMAATVKIGQFETDPPSQPALIDDDGDRR